ncbi:hypothetical protein HF1_10450 [Mycoplasma haemofelis str. Langford 1]|uniref:Uncharacterized protein n=1 Tax=Mycoplasma haemofelis (strain Langford 1) TaxID=941640 RepID=E8ZIT2_MYCHL|nr:hypothetical protein [Mycoplasma haemofelis]CBY93053.1 hypothetical protein HF1_10450 [Mycoplasma haemofelis str. Langford 1]
MRLIPALALLGIGATGFGGLYKFSNLTPRTLKEYLEWQGLNLISDSSDNYWKAVLEDSKDIAKKATSKEEPTIQDIKQWCVGNLPKEKYDDLKDYAVELCVDNPKTVKSRIIQLDGGTEKLISSGDAEKYKVAYVFRKHIDGFHDLIGYKPEVDEQGKEQENLEASKTAFQNWCEDSLKKPVDDTLVLNVRTLCTPKKFTTIKELIEQNGEKDSLLTDPKNDSELQQKFEEIKEKASWKQDKQNASSKEDLKNWCTETENKKFSDSGVFSEDYPKFRFRCIKSTTSSK